MFGGHCAALVAVAADVVDDEAPLDDEALLDGAVELDELEALDDDDDDDELDDELEDEAELEALDDEDDDDEVDDPPGELADDEVDGPPVELDRLLGGELDDRAPAFAAERADDEGPEAPGGRSPRGLPGSTGGSVGGPVGAGLRSTGTTGTSMPTSPA